MTSCYGTEKVFVFQHNEASQLTTFEPIECLDLKFNSCNTVINQYHGTWCIVLLLSVHSSVHWNPVGLGKATESAKHKERETLCTHKSVRIEIGFTY
jgi:hypothetical protein